MKIKASFILTVAALALSGSALAEVKIALVAKSLGNGFFEAANVGAQEAAKELGDVKVIYTGPTTTTAEAQIEVLNGLIAQGVDAIAISANDPDAVVPVLKKAMQRGIKVVSWDSGVAAGGRQIHLNPSNNQLIGETNVKLAADALKALNVEKGDVAILSATPTSTNQNIWIGEMKKVLPNYPSINLVTVAYGDDLSDKSYREAVGLLKSYPDLKVIVSPSSVGIVAAAQAVKDQGKTGEIGVVCFDWVPDNLQYVATGEIIGAVSQDPENMAWMSVMSVFNYTVTGEKPESTHLLTDSDLVTPDTLAEKVPDFKAQ